MERALRVEAISDAAGGSRTLEEIGLYAVAQKNVIAGLDLFLDVDQLEDEVAYES